MTAVLPRPFLHRLAADPRGATIIEFAIIIPVLLMTIMGLGELAYQEYMQSVLTGAIQKAGRDSAIQGAGSQSAQIDSVVIAQLNQLRSGWSSNCTGSPPGGTPTYCSTRKSYTNFGMIAPEPWQDNNNNNKYDAATECFTDLNGNGVWDADPGTTGQGGANDVALYTMTVTYPRIFPVASMAGMTPTATLRASTILKNQPWATQTSYAPVQICPPH